MIHPLCDCNREFRGFLIQVDNLAASYKSKSTAAVEHYSREVMCRSNCSAVQPYCNLAAHPARRWKEERRRRPRGDGGNLGAEERQD